MPPASNARTRRAQAGKNTQSQAVFHLEHQPPGGLILTGGNGQVDQLADRPIDQLAGHPLAEALGDGSVPLVDRCLQVARDDSRQVETMLYEDAARGRTWSACAFRAGDGQITLVLHDVTPKGKGRGKPAARNGMFQRFMDDSPMAASLKDKDGRFLYVNKAWLASFRKGRQPWKGKTNNDLFPRHVAEQLDARDREVFGGRKVCGAIEHIPDTTGQVRRWLIEKFPVAENGGRKVGTICIDITAEEQLKVRHRRHEMLVESIPALVYIVDLEGTPHYISPQVEDFLGFMPEEVDNWLALWKKQLHPDDAEEALEDFEAAVEAEAGVSQEYRLLARDGRELWVHSECNYVPGGDGEPALLHGVLMDITRNKQDEDRIAQLNRTLQSRVERVDALRMIDKAITSSMDRDIVLQVVLDQVTQELEVDAADILELNEDTYMLEFAAGRGFLGKSFRIQSVRMGAGYVGEAALDRRIVSVVDAAHADPPFVRQQMVEEEGFSSYFATPLIAKGRVCGVLEVWDRDDLDPDAEWLDFFVTLAGQAAIALEAISLFGKLTRTNNELVLAYDATIEGWSRALDLRDHETQGHTERVTSKALKLAGELGIRGADMVNIRRGSLLHDIGKMGIPDQVLLKQGPLNDDEWTLMRMHPTLAYELLDPIAHLRPASDIPYCHHERWGGSGYPRGLAGDLIPLPARIFCLADVYDAMTSDRPYREALSHAETVDYIYSNAGKHFDPRLVKTFRKLELQSR